MSSGHKADQDAADAAAALRDEEPVASGATADADADTPAGRERRDEARAGAEDGGAEDGSVECDLAAEVAALKDQLLRKQAEFQNFRRRLHLNKEQEIDDARKEVLLGVADVIDSLELAIRNGANADAVALRDGVSAIEKQLTGLLERKWGFRRFSAEGEPFDPGRHEAIATEESDAHEAATVVEDYQRGYLLRDSVVRCARVKVAQPLSGSNEEPARAPGDASADTKEGT